MTWVTHFSFCSALLPVVFAPVGMWSTRSVVHMSTGRRFRLAQAVIPMGNDAKIDRSVGDRPTAVVGFDQADRLADQRSVDVDRAALPADFSVVAHPPDLIVGAVVRLPQDAVVAPRRGGVTRGRHLI